MTMAKTRGGRKAATVRTWRQVPEKIEKAIDGLKEADLDLRGGKEGWSIRETVHHLVEANLIASNIVIAALAGSGSVYDWSWVYPNADWNRRMGYHVAPVGPALTLLKALGEHIAGLIAASPDAREREVRLLDAPGQKPHAETVEALLRQESEHVVTHLRDVARTREAHRMPKPRRRTS